MPDQSPTSESLSAYVERVWRPWSLSGTEAAGKLTALTAIRELVAENARLRAALVDAIELADDGWDYASTYFQEKYAVAARLTALRAVMPIISAGETVDENLGKPETPDLMSALQASLEHVPPWLRIQP